MAEAVESVMDKAKVPMRYHLKVVEKLHKALQNNEKQDKDHEATIDSLHKHYQGELNALGEQVAGHAATIDQVHSDHTTTLQSYQGEIEHLKGIQKGEDGAPGLDAPAVDEDALVSKVLSKVPMPEPGPKGDKGDTLALDDIITAVVKRIQKGDVIHINNVKGAGGFIKDGIKYRFDELMHGSGSSAGSLAGTQEKSTTVPNGVLTTFAFTHTPKVIVWNGAVQTKTDDYTVSGNSITFTASAGIPQTGDKILNIYG